MWRGGGRPGMSVAAPFVWRCLSGSTIAPFPHPAHRTGQADFPHPALGQDFTLSRATPSAASEPLLELIGFPISKSLTTCCVCLELRSLPSTGVTRLPRYYEPLRHPRAPSLSLTGFRLVIADHALGLPVFRALSLCTCCRQYPGIAGGRNLRSTRPAISTFPDMAVGSAYTSSFSRLARCGAVALGRTYLLPPLSFGGASMVPPWLRFHIPLIEPDRQISRIRLSDKTSRLRVQRLLQLLNIYRS